MEVGVVVGEGTGVDVSVGEGEGPILGVTIHTKGVEVGKFACEGEGDTSGEGSNLRHETRNIKLRTGRMNRIFLPTMKSSCLFLILNHDADQLSRDDYHLLG